MSRKLTMSLGDVNPFEHGGFFVFEYKDGSAPVMERLELIDDEVGWEVSTIALDRCTYENGILSDNPFHKDHPAWFAKDLGAVTESMGWNLAAFIAALCSENLKSRAWAYRELALYFGCLEFDQYPYTITSRKEVKARYKGYDKV